MVYFGQFRLCLRGIASKQAVAALLFAISSFNFAAGGQVQFACLKFWHFRRPDGCRRYTAGRAVCCAADTPCLIGNLCALMWNVCIFICIGIYQKV